MVYLLWLIPIFYALGLLMAVRAIMTARTPQGSIAWAVSLITLPPIAVPLYLVFGRNKFDGYVHPLRTHLRTHAGRVESFFTTLRAGRVELPAHLAPTARVLERLTPIPFTGRNAARLLVDGEATFAALFAAIEAAERYVFVQFYIVRDDDLGMRLHALLLKKAKQGVKTYLLFDALGALTLDQSYIDSLRDGGVEVGSFRTGRGLRSLQLNFRNHRKITVIDGRVAFLGGLNVGDEYLGKDPAFGPWRDTHLRLEGPAVQALQIPLVADWYWAREQLPELEWNPDPPPDAGEAVLILPSGPADDSEAGSLSLVQCVNAARRRVWLATPYFVPDPPLFEALRLAALRGVDVRIIIPEKADSIPVDLAMYSFIPACTAVGIRLFRYTEGFHHQKVMLIDDDLASIGSANLDNRSFRLNFEITAFIASPAFASTVEKMLEHDLARSRPVAETDLTDRKWWFRFAVRVARLMEPVL